MSVDPDQQSQFELLLAAYHEAVLSGRDTELPGDLSSALVQRLRAAACCVDVLDSFWQGTDRPAGATQLEAVAVNEPGAPLAGETIGRFRVERKLGHGGAGIVLLATDPKLNRLVALKVPHLEGIVSPERRQRFLREAEAAARLEHPHIVAVYEVDEAGPVCYIAAQYCNGPSLAEWLAARGTSVPFRDAAETVASLAAAVHHAHVRGVLHRDLKPSNVLLDRVSAEPADEIDLAADLSTYVAKVGDFGLAKLLEHDGDETRTGTVLGTPRYMAPEQAEGRIRDIGVHTDVHALGTILYELLTGAPPFSGATDSDTLRRLLLDDPVPPRRLRPGVPQDLEAICLKCLEKTPDRRYATAAELEEDLRRYLAGEPTLVRSLGFAGRVWKWARRRPAIAGLATVLAIALLTIFVGTLVYSARLELALSEMSRQRDIADDAARSTRQILYTEDMQRAGEAWRNNRVAEVLKILERQKPRRNEEDQREFSWYFLRGLSQGQVATLTGHQGDVFSVACSPDGKTWASGGKDATVRLWDVATGKQRQVLKGHTGEVTRVVFDPSGTTLASASEDHSVRLWSLADGTERQVLTGHADHVLCLAFSPDGKWLASGSRDKTVRVWDAKSSSVIAQLEGHDAIFASIDFSRRSDLLVAGDGSGRVFCWGTDQWQLLNEDFERDEHMWALAHSPDEDWIAGGGRLSVVHLWEQSGDGLRKWNELSGGHAFKIQALAFSPAGNSLASADQRGVIQLWDMHNLGEKRTILGHAERVWSLAWSPDNPILASGGADGTIRVWHTSARFDGARTYAVESKGAPVVAFTPQGDLLAAACGDSKVRWFDTRTLALIDAMDTSGSPWGTIYISPDGKLLAHRASDGTTGVRQRGAAADCLSIPGTEDSGWNACDWSPDGQSLVTTIDETTAVIVEVPSGRIKRKFESTGKIANLKFSPDGLQLAMAAERLFIWNSTTGKCMFDLDQSSSVHYSADSRTLAAETTGDIRVYEARTGRVLRNFARAVQVHLIALSPDGKTLAGGVVAPSAIILWDLRTGQELLTITPEGRRLTSLVFSPSGDRLVATGVGAHRKSKGNEGQIWEWAIRRDED